MTIMTYEILHEKKMRWRKEKEEEEEKEKEKERKREEKEEKKILKCNPSSMPE